MSDINFNTVEDGQLLKWENVGTKLVGILKSYTSRPTRMGEGHIYEVQTKDGITPFFAPSLLHKKLQNVSVGYIVSIEYTKKTKTGSNTDLKHFNVGWAKPSEANLKAMGIELFSAVEDEAEVERDFETGNPVE